MSRTAPQRARHEARSEATSTYAEAGPRIPNPDGSIEHTPLRVRTDIKEHDEAEPCALEKMTAEERMRSTRNYEAQADAARIHYGREEWDDVLDATVPIPVSVVAAIQQLGLRNPHEVSRFIGTHREVADELTQMRKHPRRVVRRIQEISHQLEMGELGLDRAPYREFQVRRQREIRGRR